MVHRRLPNKCGIQIPARIRIGPGLYIGHRMGIIVNWTATVGSDCNTGQSTTIGSNDENAARIGDNATIGAGSIVVEDVPADAAVAGTPARVISCKAPGRYIQAPWRS